MKKHAAIVIKNDNGEILFIRRSMKKKTLPGIWSFPSGTVEDNEDIMNTSVRESMEELGVVVEPRFIFAEKELPEFSVCLSFVLCNIINGEPEIVEMDEIDEIRWMRFEEFFDNFSDDEIGHGLVWLRRNSEILNNVTK